MSISRGQDFAAARVAMVDRQVRPSDVTSFPIIDAMLRIPRERFTPAPLRAAAYADAPIPLGPSREMLAPRTFAKMLDGARIGPDDLVLDLFPGLGYSTAVIARIAAAVIAIEPDEAMAADAADRLTAEEIDNAILTAGDPLKGDPAHGPYDAIFINGGIGRAPDMLAPMLREGGRIVAILMDGPIGRATAYIRAADRLEPRPLFDATAETLPGFAREDAFSL